MPPACLRVTGEGSVHGLHKGCVEDRRLAVQFLEVAKDSEGGGYLRCLTAEGPERDPRCRRLVRWPVHDPNNGTRRYDAATYGTALELRRVFRGSVTCLLYTSDAADD